MAVRPAAGILPTTGVVLIGTARSVRSLAAQVGHLATVGEPVIPVGCVLINRLPEAVGVSDPGVLPPVLGYVDELIGLQAKWRFSAAVVSLPASMREESRRIGALLNQLGITAKFIPTFEDLLQGTAGTPTRATAAPLDVSALIGRTPWGVDKASVSKIIAGKRVLITGAGGSIGGELARVCAAFKPSCVILMERSENALFEIDQQLSRRFPSLPRLAVLHDVVDEASTKRKLMDLKPDVVFHAAAHKHVPLMEDHPSHAVNNNLFGTKSIADASLAAGVERFVMISSDKAVNPTSVMGATKRLAEMYIQSLAAERDGNGHSGKTRFSMVRFGNVLASACSVIPIWSQQLAEGHPLIVTDPRMTRYFMTIPEASTLVVQAAALDQQPGTAPVYVLDMGEPISILEMAVRFLRQQGLGPAIDTSTIPAAAISTDPDRQAVTTQIAALTEDDFDTVQYTIKFSGARPGEKLYEELAYSAEMLAPTAHPAIGQWGRDGSPRSAAALLADLSALRSPTSDKAKVVDAIRKHVPEMVR